MDRCDGQKLTARAYQLEMFEASMQRNIIAFMGTGTGKTNIACLRMQAELQRTSNKRVWFTVPTKPLADQQHEFLASQLPEYLMKTLTGDDGVQFWSSQEIWDAALMNTDVVISTPQVLLDALNNGFVSLEDISLLVVDEAHHCQANSPSALIMRKHYHPLKRDERFSVPHILGLTASIRTSVKSATVHEVEALLDAQCRLPTTSTDEYVNYINMPDMVGIPYCIESQSVSALLSTLSRVVSETDFHQDPSYKALQEIQTEEAEQKLAKWERRKGTATTKDIEAFQRNAEHLHSNLGPWACDYYIEKCLARWRDFARNAFQSDSDTLASTNFVTQRLAPFESIPIHNSYNPKRLSAKVQGLIEFLSSEYHEGIAVVIFVERKSTAYALCQLLSVAPELGRYRAFSFVGHKAAASSPLVDPSEHKAQRQAFIDFRNGINNVCVATSIAEEGIDIQAVNIVIRYDDPPNLRALLQSRGRARSQNSKFVYLYDSLDTAERYNKLLEDEQMMLADATQERALLEIADDMDIQYDHAYIVASTNAKLFYSNAVAHMQHFCAVIASGTNPIYLLYGESGVAMTAKVVLPSCVPASHQEFCSLRSWRGEKAAKRDAAFQGYKALHEAGLVTDNLVPFQRIVVRTPQIRHQFHNCDITGEHNVWRRAEESVQYSRYRLDFSCSDVSFSTLFIAVPGSVDHKLSFSVFEAPERSIIVNVVPLGRCTFQEVTAAKALTQELFAAAFHFGSAWESLDDPARISVSILPDQEAVATNNVDFTELKSFMDTHSAVQERQPLFIWKDGKSDRRPYLWIPTQESQDCTDTFSDIKARKVKRLRIMTSATNLYVPNTDEAKYDTLTAANCYAKGLLSVLGPSVSLLPSVLHMMGAALRAQQAKDTILASIGFKDSSFLTPALTALSASGSLNYERLEFIGDAYLKFRASLQMYYDHSLAMEGMLTHRTQEIVSNERLESLVREIGLDTFVTTETPSQRHWKLPLMSDDEIEKRARRVNSKLLADVVESVLAAAFLDGERYGRDEENSTAVLCLFLPEINWLLPTSAVRQILSQRPSDEVEGSLTAMIEHMFGYKFRHHGLLREALTHSSSQPGKQSLDRLEFLGDAILDWIIKARLSAHNTLSPGRMSTIRHALASHAFLAFCALRINTVRPYQKVERGDKGFELKEIREAVYLVDLIQFREMESRVPIAAARKKAEVIQEDVLQALASGIFPWTLFRSINAPKTCSDILESLIAAVYIDSGGRFEECDQFIESLEMFDVIDRMAKDDKFEARTPAIMLRELCASQQLVVEIKILRQAGSSLYGGQVIVSNSIEKIVFRHMGDVVDSKDEARSNAAEQAFEILSAPGRSLELFDGSNDNSTLDIAISGVDIRGLGEEVVTDFI